MPSAVPPSFGVCRTHRDRRPGDIPLAIGAARYRWRSAPEPTGLVGGLVARIPRVRSGGSRVHSPPPSPRFPPTTGSLCRRSTGTRPVHSPYSYQWRGWWQDTARASSGHRRHVTRHPVARTPRSRRPAASGSADSGRPSSIARTGGTSCRGSCGWGANGDRRRTVRAAVPSAAPSRSRAVVGQPSALGRPRPAMAERVGFEPTKSFDSALFKSAAINRSATSPGRQG